MVSFTLASLLLVAGLATALPNAEPVQELPFSSHSLHLDREARSVSSPGLRRRSSSGQLFSSDGNNQFSTTVKFGGTPFKLIIDTGSSDTWIVGKGFQCVDPNGNEVSIDQCGFGDVYAYGKDPTLDQNPTEAGENFLVSYGSGEVLTGALATDTVNLAGIKFNTEIGVALKGFFNGDGTVSGLVGLAFPLLTSAFTGTHPSQDGPDTRVPYDSILTQLFRDNKYTPAMFTLVLSRDLSQSGYGGSLTIGGVPNLSDPRVNAANKFTYSPIVPTLLVSDTDLSFYTIEVDTVSWGSGSSKGSDSVANRRWAVDSGTSLIYAPTAIAQAYNALWQTKTFHPKEGIWTVPCGSTPPAFSVTIGGTVFNINPKDLIQLGSSDGSSCISSIVDVGGNPPLLLGDVFLKNVVAVFDWGNQRLGFSARTTYQS